jgi:hypothetical protein
MWENYISRMFQIRFIHDEAYTTPFPDSHDLTTDYERGGEQIRHICKLIINNILGKGRRLHINATA